ncbi:MAG: hypothetical protein GX431_07290 [Bacteroidales bacterium]|nr:hypothetical protein [Bacteroidales bacterium]
MEDQKLQNSQLIFGGCQIEANKEEQYETEYVPNSAKVKSVHSGRIVSRTGIT